MKSLQALLLVLAVLALSGCPNTAYFEPTPIANTGKAMVYFYRPAATNPGAARPLRLSYPEIMVDGNSVGFLKYNRYLAVEVEPGLKELLVTGLTPDARWEPKDLSYKLKMDAGETYFMRLKVEFDTDKMSLGTFKGQYIINFHPVKNTDAVYEIRHTDEMQQ